MNSFAPSNHNLWEFPQEKTIESQVPYNITVSNDDVSNEQDTASEDEKTFRALYLFCEQYEKFKASYHAPNYGHNERLRSFNMAEVSKTWPQTPPQINHEYTIAHQKYKVHSKHNHLPDGKVTSNLAPIPMLLLPSKSGSIKRKIVKTSQPIKPLSAYNFFFSDERERILSGRDTDIYDDKKKQSLLMKHLTKNRSKRRPHRKTHGKIDFKTLTRLIVKRWKALSKEQKQFYYDVADIDFERYTRESLATTSCDSDCNNELLISKD